MNILITGAWQSANQYIEQIKALGHQVIFQQYEKDSLSCSYEWVEGIIGNGIFLSHSIEKFTNLKYIQLTSAGYDRVPMEYVERHGIEIHNAKGVYSIPIAEYVISSVLQLYKRTNMFRSNQKKHIWQKCREIQELFGKKVVILGCGSIGTECAKRFQIFGCNVSGVAKTARKKQPYFDEIVATKDLGEVLPKADILVVAIPYTDETRHLIDQEHLAYMKDGAVIVNVARGEIIDTEALISNLPKLGGVVLDVYEQEPLPEDSPLWEYDHVLLTPHNSFIGEGNQDRLAKVIIDNLK